MEIRPDSLLFSPAVAAALALASPASADILSFDGNVATDVTTHNISATDWADYVGGSDTFNSANDWGRLYWRGSAGDGQYIHFDLSSLTGLTVVAPTTVTLRNANPTWGASVNGSYVATANGAWTAAGGASIPGATAISHAVNAIGSHGSGASVSWGIGSTPFQDIVDNQGSFHGLAVIGGSGSQLHFTGPMDPYLTVHTGTLSAPTEIITADTGSSTWNAGNYAFVASNAYSPTLNTLTISGELIAGTSGAGTITIQNGGTVAVNQAGSANYYWALDGTTNHAGGRLTSSGHSHIRNLTLAGGELASNGIDAGYGGWQLDDPTTVTGDVTSTISARQVTLASGVFDIDSGSTLNFTGSARAGSLTKNGPGTMVLSGENTYTGWITVNSGVLALAPNSAWVLQGGSGVTVNSGATLQGNSSVANRLNGLTLNDGTVSATGSNTDWGNFFLTGNVTATGTSHLNADIALRTSNVDFNVASGGALHVGGVLHNGYQFASTGTPGGSPATVTKSGAGTMILGGTNTYSGATTVAEGVLSIANPSALPSYGVVAIQSGAVMDLDFTGEMKLGGLTLDGVRQPAGLYGADTHPTFFTGTGQVRVLPLLDNDLADASSDGLSNFRRMKYGYFVHYVWDGAGNVTRNVDGSNPISIDDVADRFDAEAFANDMEAIGVEYVIFTAWHANFFPLYPSSAMDGYFPGRTPSRDMIGGMIDAVRAKGIRVVLYTHPMQPLSWDQNTHNNIINDVYAELVERYGDRIDGLFLDENDPNGQQDSFVDYPRLIQTIKSRQKDLILIQNFYGNRYGCDIGQMEALNYTGIFNQPSGVWPAQTMPHALVMSTGWSANTPFGVNTVRFSAEDMFRYTVLQAGSNTDGGGVTWAAGPYVGGDVWETGVIPAMVQVGNYIRPIRRSICNTVPSQSWITPLGATLNSITNGFIATRSPDDGSEFVHVLRPPAANTITLPAPADGRSYVSARLLESGNPVALTRNEDGSLTLTLAPGDTWNVLNTVIELTPVQVTWNGNDETEGPGTGIWSTTADNFTGGAPVATRFASGDNVNFTAGGASNVYCEGNWSVGDLSFAGQDYDIHPLNSPVLTLASGRIDVANGITATFHETGSGGPMTITGTAGLIKTGGGALVMEPPTAYSGNTILEDGELKSASGALGTSGNISFQGGTLTYLPGNTDDISPRLRHSQSPIAIDTGGNEVVFARSVGATNTGGLTKSGAGTLSLTASNDFTGDTTVLAGTLSLGDGMNNTNLADSAAVIVASGAMLHLNYSGTDMVASLSFGGIARPPGVYSAANSPFITGSGTLTVTTGPATDYEGWTTFHNLTGGQTGDDDQDGLTNHAEYAFGTDPKNGASCHPVTGTPSPAPRHRHPVTFIRHRYLHPPRPLAHGPEFQRLVFHQPRQLEPGQRSRRGPSDHRRRLGDHADHHFPRSAVGTKTLRRGPRRMTLPGTPSAGSAR